MASHSGGYGEGNPPIPAIDEATVVFMINRSLLGGPWTGTWTEQQVYEATRCSWVVGADVRERAVYALGVRHGVVRGAYRIERWYPARPGRWCFEGVPALELAVIGTSFERLKGPQGASNPVRKFLSGIPGCRREDNPPHLQRSARWPVGPSRASIDLTCA